MVNKTSETNKPEPRKSTRKGAVALRYDPEQEKAPRVLAQGQGLIAEKILALAEKHSIPIHNDPDLLEVLTKIDIGMEIPPQLYQVIAEVLVFVYSMNNRYLEMIKK